MKIELLKEGMIFNSGAELARILDFKDQTHTNNILLTLSHFCEYHRDDKKRIYVDKVFENPKPFRNLDFIYQVGDIIKTQTGQILIIDRYRKKTEDGHNRKCYKCKCLIDNYIFEIIEHRIKDGVGCPLCGNRKIIPGKRSLYDCHPEILQYLEDPEVAKLYSPKSSKLITCRCKICGFKKDIPVSQLVTFGFSCNMCSDGISYPNKFMSCLLNQLGIDYIPEKSFEWSNGKMYDHYVIENNLLIENHGKQHYENMPNSMFGNLEEIQANDIYKQELAVQNGYNYCVIDCSYSDANWIKNSIMNSNLYEILCFSENDIDWNYCDIFASSSLYKQIWDDWNKFQDINYILLKYEKYYVKRGIFEIIKKGIDIGVCNTNVDIINLDHQGIQKQSNNIPIYCVNDNLYFFSSDEVYDYYGDNLFPKKTKTRSMINSLRKNMPYKGKTFIYISKEEFNYQKTKSEDLNLNNVYGDYFSNLYMR